MKKVAIVADNYKIPSFRARLLKEKFVITFEGALTAETTLIKVTCDEKRIAEIAVICAELEIKFHEQKAKNN